MQYLICLASTYDAVLFVCLFSFPSIFGQPVFCKLKLELSIVYCSLTWRTFFLVKNAVLCRQFLIAQQLSGGGILHAFKHGLRSLYRRKRHQSKAGTCWWCKVVSSSAAVSLFVQQVVVMALLLPKMRIQLSCVRTAYWIGQCGHIGWLPDCQC